MGRTDYQAKLLKEKQNGALCETDEGKAGEQRMETDYAARIAEYVDGMRIKKAFGGFDRLDTYHQMQELGKRCAALLEEALYEKDQSIGELTNRLSECMARQTQTDVALLVAEQQAKWIIDTTNSFVQDEQQLAQRIFHDTLRQQQRAVSELEARKKELKLEISKLEAVIREIKGGFAAMSGQLAKYRTGADRGNESIAK